MRAPFVSAVAMGLAVAGCVGPFDVTSATDDVTSAAGSEYTIEFDSFVYVSRGASDGDVREAIRRQVKSSLGALRERGIGVLDRDAERNLARGDWRRAPVDVVAGGEVVDRLDRVTYRYRDTAIVAHGAAAESPVSLTLLAGDYAARRDDLVPDCTDDPDAEADSLWYHFHPGRSACRRRIARERDAINAAMESLDDPSAQISTADRDRLFVTTVAALTPVDGVGDTYPEYDRLWGFAGDPSRAKVVVYAFFGVDRDEADPRDWGLREFLRFERTLRARFPELRVVHTDPFAMLLDFWIDGAKVDGVTFDDVERWVLDGTGFPPAAASPAARDALLAQVVERFSERWIVWQLPVTVDLDGATRDMTVEIRTYYGYEDGSWEARQRATWRYLEAFWHADVFAYTGHSHFGHGPLAPFGYRTDNFPWRYQVMLINSCLSFNYYDQDFIDMHPGGADNLDVVVNGLAAYWAGMGEATARYVIGLIDGEGKTWRELLASMRVDLPWVRAYDPLRAVNGERGNRFAGGALRVSPR